MNGKVLFLLLNCFMFLFCGAVDAFDDGVSHRDITISAVENSVLKSYLSQNLGQDFSLNYKSAIKGKMVIEWIKDGAIAEDTPTCRASNHFHNPLKPWDKAGMGIYQISYLSATIDAFCLTTSPQYTDKHSNVLWATGYLAPSPDGPKSTTNNTKNWDYARYYYEKALTNYSKTERESYFASTFTALGQVMHLLEDMAVPAHVRNDFKSHMEGI